MSCVNAALFYLRGIVNIPGKVILKLSCSISEGLSICQIDGCRVGGVNENLAIMLMAAKAGVPVCPHAGQFPYAHMQVSCRLSTRKSVHVCPHAGQFRSVHTKVSSRLSTRRSVPVCPHAGKFPSVYTQVSSCQSTRKSVSVCPHAGQLLSVNTQNSSCLSAMQVSSSLSTRRSHHQH